MPNCLSREPREVYPQRDASLKYPILYTWTLLANTLFKLLKWLLRLLLLYKPRLVSNSDGTKRPTNVSCKRWVVAKSKPLFASCHLFARQLARWIAGLLIRFLLLLLLLLLLLMVIISILPLFLFPWKYLFLANKTVNVFHYSSSS